MRPENWREAGFGLYVHWPFCQAKCPYCDFNSHVVGAINQEQWKNAYVAEIRRAGAETPGRVLSTIFFGGGTPSLMEPDLVGAIIEEARETWPMVNDPEITLEANPTSVEAGRFKGFHDAGVTRVSMGIQALNDADLRRLGRMHTVADARGAFEIARDVFERTSFDLIYARQDQTRDAWRRELEVAIAMAADHMSLYQLTIEDGTAFGDRMARGLLKGLPDEDAAADMYELTQDVCGAAGLPAYEISNHARPDSESRHNLIYWNCGDYVGVGPGAHGRLSLDDGRFATETHLAPGGWLDAATTRGSGESRRDLLSEQENLEEFVLMGLRLREGIDLDRRPGLEKYSNNINRLCEDGFLECVGSRVRATAAGRPLLNEVLRRFFF